MPEPESPAAAWLRFGPTRQQQAFPQIRHTVSPKTLYIFRPQPHPPARLPTKRRLPTPPIVVSLEPVPRRPRRTCPEPAESCPEPVEGENPPAPHRPITPVLLRPPHKPPAPTHRFPHLPLHLPTATPTTPRTPLINEPTAVSTSQRSPTPRHPTWPPAPHPFRNSRQPSLHRNQRPRRMHWLHCLHCHQPLPATHQRRPGVPGEPALRLPQSLPQPALDPIRGGDPAHRSVPAPPAPQVSPPNHTPGNRA